MVELVGVRVARGRHVVVEAAPPARPRRRLVRRI